MIEKHRNPDGTYDGAGVMSEVSGMSRESITGLWAEVKANHARLEACPRHDFGPLGDPARLGVKYECRNCRGTADASAVRWYQQGLAHAAA